MAIADREYWTYQPRRRHRTVVGELFALAPVTAWLIAINVAVYVLDRVLPPVTVGLPNGYATRMGILEWYGHFSAATTIYGFELWRLITFQFLHDHSSPWHLLLNMMTLYFFGPMVERYLGSAKYLRYYLICGVGGAVAYLAMLMTGVLITEKWVPLVGASAGIFGVLVSAAHIAPHRTVMLIFPPVPMRLRTLAWAFIAIAIWTVLTQGRNAGGEAAHLGGALVGFALMHGQKLLGDSPPPRRRFDYADEH